ncbi:transcriptional regulator, TetR family [Frankia torreyi]|uniref:Transcriptional regulator, TetR family n=1 Tax=Frankia torreyi TaxID=1856 RepID=A0A0D8BIM7_9ACTN|nr:MULTISPECIES: TetR/AcrR family transcriptional regulator [Frankia]KJE23242.1 transcriptional regulator, TetR family [Frankia torreyi]KQM06545.1 transcriptional regulator, TetR family [Frankia sp. CpI1-P]
MALPDSAGPPQAERHLRADARRNYERLLTAAAAVFREQGVDAALDEVARQAGVGNATMYRHFPTRQDLIVAVYSDEVDALCARGESLLSDQRADDALFMWLHDLVRFVGDKRELALALGADVDSASRSGLFNRWHSAMYRTVTALVVQEQQRGTLRDDVDGWDLLVLVNGIALGGVGPERVGALLDLVRRGAAPGPATGTTGT